MDGMFWSVSDKIIVTYLTVYFLTVGATRAQIGMLSSLNSLAAAIILLPGAMLVEKFGRRKYFVVLFASLGRVIVLLCAVLPFFLKGNFLIWVLIIFAIMREALNFLTYPAWYSLTADIIPIEGRGRFFGSRNFIIGAAGILTAISIGGLITAIGEPLGHQVALMIAFVFGMGASFFYSRIKEPEPAQPAPGQPVQTPLKLKNFFKEFQGQKAFLFFCIACVVWNFSINISGPFFVVFKVDTLSFTAFMIGINTVVNTVANLSVQRKAGAFLDRFGSKNILFFSWLFIPILPLLWGYWVTQAWQAYFIDIFGGILWGIEGLAIFHFLLSITPEDRRARFSAIHQMLVMLSLSAGAAVGSYIISIWQFRGVVTASAIGRVIAAILFAIFFIRFKRKQKTQTKESLIKQEA